MRGSPNWEGYYIDEKSFHQVSRRLGLKYHQNQQNSQKTSELSCTFSNNNIDDSVIVAAEDVLSLMFLNRDGKGVKWLSDMKVIDIATAAKE